MVIQVDAIICNADIRSDGQCRLSLDSIAALRLLPERHSFQPLIAGVVKQSVSQSFATPMQFDWDGGSQTGWLLGMTFKECEAQKALG